MLRRMLLLGGVISLVFFVYLSFVYLVSHKFIKRTTLFQSVFRLFSQWNCNFMDFIMINSFQVWCLPHTYLSFTKTEIKIFCETIKFRRNPLIFRVLQAPKSFLQERPMVDVSDSETRKCRVHVSECVTKGYMSRNAWHGRWAGWTQYASRK